MKKIFCIILYGILAACSDERSHVDLKILSVADFIRLENRMITEDEDEFDALWYELKTRLDHTIQTKGLDYYSFEDRYQMASSLEFNVGLNSEYVTQKHGASIQEIVHLLEWPDMWRYIFENPSGTGKEWEDKILNKPPNANQ